MLNSFIGNGSTIGTVNINISNGGREMNSQVNPAALYAQKVDNDRIEHNSSVEQIEDQSSQVILVEADEILFEFENMYIDQDYNIHIHPDFDLDNRPTGKFTPLNDFYITNVSLDDKLLSTAGKFYGNLVVRDDEKIPPVLILLDWNEIHQEMIDQMIYHAMLFAKSNEHDSFWISFETSGNYMLGEPYDTGIYSDKYISTKEVLKVSFR